MRNRYFNIYKNIFLSAIFIFVFFLFTQSASAATLYLSPSSKSVDVGNIVNVSVIVNSGGEAINSADATINFPNDLLEVVSVSKSGSIFSMWVEEPSFSNAGGVISFSGGVPNPGFNGSSGKVIGIVFKVKNKGNASVVFSTASVRANDGLGTDVLKGTGQSSISIQSTKEEVKDTKKEDEQKAAEAKKLAEENKLTGSVSIKSSTHPDPNKKYESGNVKFSWNIPKNAISLKLSVDQSPYSTPKTLSKLINKYEIKNATPGTWYLHLQFASKTETGRTEHFKFQIEPKKVDKPIVEDKKVDIHEVNIALNGDVQKEEASCEINEDLVVVNKYTRRIYGEESFIALGTAKASSTINLWMQDGENKLNSYEVTVDDSGNFNFYVDGLADGLYTFWFGGSDTSKNKEIKKYKFVVGDVDSSSVNILVFFGGIIFTLIMFLLRNLIIPNRLLRMVANNDINDEKQIVTEDLDSEILIENPKTIKKRKVVRKSIKK